MPLSVLVVDDEKNILVTFARMLEIEGYAPVTASSGAEALEKVAAQPVDVVVSDVKMPDLSGLELLAKLKAIRPELPVVMMSGHGTIEMAVSAVKSGAHFFLEKPVEKDRLLVTLRNALQLRRLAEENAELRREAAVGEEMLGAGPAMKLLRERIARTANSEGRVLILGENGTGKELVARALHAGSPRKDRPFVKLNCAAVPAELIESELFGHERGAFTGAVAARKGKFELADGGTLFLDEVGDMPASMQAKLLRVLQEGELERVGGQQTIKVDVRTIAATNKDIDAEVKAGRFREDLYYRLNVVPLRTPPLRERKEDVPVLADRFLVEACAKNGRRPMTFARDAYLALQSHAWPGNVRELRNLVERIAILCDGPAVSPDDVLMFLPGTARKPRPDRFREGATLAELVDEAEREIISAALERNVGEDGKPNISETARALGLERSHLYKKMKALGMRRGEEGA